MKRIACLLLASTLCAGPALAQAVGPGQPGLKPKPQVRFCAGRSDGVYYYAANVVKKFAMSLDVKPIETQGSFDNLNRLIEGQCDAAFVQNDALKVYGMRDARAVSGIERATSIYKEYIHLVCNREAKISSISQLTSKHTVAIGPDGSGTQQSWQALVDSNPKKYSAVQTETRDGIRALTAVADGSDITCMIYVGGVGSRLLKEDAKRFGDKIVLAAADDAAFGEAKDAKGRPIYSYETIPASVYPAVMPKGVFGGGKDVKTVAVDAVVVVNSQWVERAGSNYDTLLRGVTTSIPAIKQRAEPLK